MKSNLKIFFIFCAIACFIGVFKLPIEYYTFLRTLVSVGAVLAILGFRKAKNQLFMYIFVGIFILFNPIIPIYLYQKSIWIPIDVIVGVLFLLIDFSNKKEKTEEEPDAEHYQENYHHRDRIVTPKNFNSKEEQ